MKGARSESWADGARTSSASAAEPNVVQGTELLAATLRAGALADLV